jgi:hypothetical protein
MYNPNHALQFVDQMIAEQTEKSQQFNKEMQEEKAKQEAKFLYRLFRMTWEPGFMDWINWHEEYLKELKTAREKIIYHVKMGYNVVDVTNCYRFKFEKNFYAWCAKKGIPV